MPMCAPTDTSARPAPLCLRPALSHRMPQAASEGELKGIMEYTEDDVSGGGGCQGGT